MRIQIKVKKSQVLEAYQNSMEHYENEERNRYMENAKEDIGGWLGDYILFLIGVTASGAVLHNVKEVGLILVIDYEYSASW